MEGTTAMITLNSNLFPYTEGTIKYYSIIVAEDFSNNLTDHGWLTNSSWPKISTWAEAISQTPIPPYQATPMYWEPFKGRFILYLEILWNLNNT